jgi:hypothetical protein
MTTTFSSAATNGAANAAVAHAAAGEVGGGGEGEREDVRQHLWRSRAGSW